MSKSTCTVTINGKKIKANVGDTLIDAGLGGRLVLPHDCCSGQCETCKVRVLSGQIDDQGTREKDTVLGCLAMLEGDAEIAYDPVPIVKTTKGKVESIRAIKDDYLEVRVRVVRPVTWLPGQYLRASFAGYPPRDYSPTTPLNLDAEEDIIVFHIKVYPDSIVSSKLGKEIGIGHAVKLRGPFGNAFLRRQPEPLVLTSTGTGFAPIWSIAVAASMGQPGREIRLIAGARTRDGLYMRDAVRWLQARGIPITLTASDGDNDTVMTDRPHQLIGSLTSDHVVYSAGAPAHVEAMRELARRAGATFYADPFYVAEEDKGLAAFAGNLLRKASAPFSGATAG
ncbi:2Fe-2S iron-sulfur cluster-binding protein [Roseibium sediminicola]|uniref:2Fe-2S iron-sulfur cluster-binding protein n=1 Tax=Roseibium sediminicola TaxID=2933272 RepID=A0ABT0GYK6_9HYPH|nr:2Fe-2S iron-sulfur cluster-binding protein [Roseibium sp. CAU 1639]MCK7613903.1 2Fe-2S iron-sulfur cluster-binding protein [Roseibium sp. CAU 1639]